MKKWIKRVLLALVAMIVIAGAGFYVWSQITYKPTEKLAEQIKGSYEQEQGWVSFGDENSKVGVIIYPGAKVKPEAYGGIGKSLAEKGYFVAIPEMTLNFAIFEKDAAKEIQEKYKNINKWVIGGHSLGGVVATMYAVEENSNIDGIFYLASYPTESADLSQDNRPVLSIYGGNDGLIPIEKIEESKQWLPEQTNYIEIQGGNHAGFGTYGEQSGDNEAEISNEQQQSEIIVALLEWLENIK